MIVGLTTFYVQSKEAIGSINYLNKFAGNSDTWHTLVVGTSFAQGQPENRNFDTGKIRDVISGRNTNASRS